MLRCRVSLGFTRAVEGTDDLSMRCRGISQLFDPLQTGLSQWLCEAAAPHAPSPAWLSQCTHPLHPVRESQAFSYTGVNHSHTATLMTLATAEKIKQSPHLSPITTTGLLAHSDPRKLLQVVSW